MSFQQEISINFFPLSSSEFNFTVYRRLYKEGELKTNFPSCTKRRLPIVQGSDEWSDYWVKLDKNDLNGFDAFECHSSTNFPLSIEFLYQLLIQKCDNIQNIDYLLSKDGFRYHTIFFSLHKFPEGRQGIWLEPYYLRSAKKIGFLADFKFYTSNYVPFTKRIQQLSLSLDQYGRSNVNFYMDRYEKLEEFLKQFYPLLFPLHYADKEINIERNLFKVKSYSLRSKNYVFAENKTNKSQFIGVKNNGPLMPILSPVKVYFIYRESDRQFSLDLYRALRGDSFSSTFSGMQSMFRYKLGSDNVSGSTVKDFTSSELERTINSILQDAHGSLVVPLVVIPFSKDDYDDDASEQYYIAKYTFLSHHLSSQFVSLKRLQNKEQLKWAISNIGLQLFAKMGGQPWKVTPETEKCLIIGLGQSHKRMGDTIEKYFAYSVLTDSSGLYKNLKFLGNQTIVMLIFLVLERS